MCHYQVSVIPSPTTSCLFIDGLVGNTAPVLTSSKPTTEEKPWFLGYDYDESEIVFTVDANVKGGTLRALVERCTLHDALDTTFVNNFLLTYRSFTTSEEFLNLLFKRFQVQPPPGLTAEEMEIWRSKKQKPIQLRVFNIIKQWLESIYHEDDDAGLLNRLHEFIRTTMSPHLKTVSLLKLIEKRQTKTNDYTLRKLVRNIKQEAPPSIMPKNLKKLKFLDIDPTEFARQLTIMDSGLYNKITPVECLNKAWSNKENSCAVNIKAMIEISNHLTHWVIESILQEKVPHKRAHLIRHFVAIADRCMSLNNYNSLMAILAGLNSAPIHRLKRTWELIPTKSTVVLDMLKARMNQTKNFSTYREGLHSIDPPCVPFLGVYLTDLTFIDDGNPDKLPGTDLINFSKYSKCADVITEIQQYQKLPYCLTTVPQIKLFLERNLQGGRDVQDLYNMSLNMEPREREDEKIARLLHESGFL
ncbi:ras guanine nucleotide exchange factor domain-containing protein [Syncephalis pseudoplumigaleata]|uniref:Ras guanine nucleotide exchange factor domain-containing protein n=1 Tax=Syncephalis pseudoplumigaleata TaxID=1712513 RepID=A0A4P9Z3L5_9FUNG|nr:ras guanine nucleotide exchange factor domain-containing protein [Syncephalis pseudoplumigaleata]|eukprot:RKP27015.1 ras guanine nucleotide exchange factor domain-containing protein [Syncephalis pseudoplumigaleata]